MQGERDRDQAIDRALRQTLRTPMNSPGATPRGDCIDGDTLAAWSEGRLRSGEAALVEEHLSDCTRCQHLLATFARTAPPATETRPGWRGWRFRWLVPVATAATVAGIWFTAPRKAVPPVTPPIADQTVRAPAPPAPPERQAATAFESAPASANAERSAATPQAAARSTGRFVDRVGTSTAEKRVESDRRARETQDRATGQTAGNPEGIPSPAQEPVSSLQERVVVVQPPTPVVDAQTPTPPARSEIVQGAPPATPSTASARAGNDARLLAAQSFARNIEIVSPLPANRWRIVNTPPRRVERSVTAGSQWEMVNIPADGVYTAGTSPSPTVCWIVGQGGAVFLTTDGLRFTRLPFPEAVNLIAVTATDDRRATVMSADGQFFRTEDQGLSWTRP